MSTSRSKWPPDESEQTPVPRDGQRHLIWVDMKWARYGHAESCRRCRPRNINSVINRDRSRIRYIWCERERVADAYVLLRVML